MNSSVCCHTFTKDTALVPWKRHCHICHEPVLFLSKTLKCTCCYCIVHEFCYADMIKALQTINELAERSARHIPQGTNACAQETCEGTRQDELSTSEKSLCPTEAGLSQQIPTKVLRKMSVCQDAEENTSTECLHDHRGVQDGNDECSLSGKSCSSNRDGTLHGVNTFSTTRSNRGLCKGKTWSVSCVSVSASASASCSDLTSSTQQSYRETYPFMRQKTATSSHSSQTASSLPTMSPLVHDLDYTEPFWTSVKKVCHTKVPHVAEIFFLRRPPSTEDDKIGNQPLPSALRSEETLDVGIEEPHHSPCYIRVQGELKNSRPRRETYNVASENNSYASEVASENASEGERDHFHPSALRSTANVDAEGLGSGTDTVPFYFQLPQDILRGNLKDYISGHLPSVVPFRFVSHSLSAASSYLFSASLSAASFVTSPTSLFDAQTLLRFYLDTWGRNSRNDPNVLKILESVFELLVFFQAKHPSLKSRIFNLLSIGEVGRRHHREYDLCVQDLHEVPMDSFTSMFAWGSDEACEDRAKEKSDLYEWRGVAQEPKSTPDELRTADVRASSPTNHLTIQEAVQRGVLTGQKNTLPALHHPVIQQLHDILRFAIAVYGSPYHNGSLSSVLGAALLFTVHKLKIASLPKGVNDEAVTNILSLPPSALKLSRWGSRATEISYILVVEHVKRRIVLSFRGTITDTDILTDICALGEPFCGGLAHQGVARTVNALFDRRASRQRAAGSVASPEPAHKNCPSSLAKVGGKEEINNLLGTHAEGAVSDTSDDAATVAANRSSANQGPRAPQLEDYDSSDELLDTLEQLVSAFPSYKIIITGHSLGGGVAVLFAIRLSYEKIFPPDVLRRIHVISFAPMPTLTLPAAAWFDEGGKYHSFPIWSIVNGCDIVPRLQVNSLHRLFREICMADQVAAGGSYSVTRPTTAEVGPEVDTSLSSNGEQDDSHPTQELHHPGRVFLLTSPWDTKNNRLVEVPRQHKVMHQIFLMRPMLNTHLINNYMGSLRNLKPLVQPRSR